MNLLSNFSKEERSEAIRRVYLMENANNRKLSPQVIEKDWYVTIILKALTELSCSEYVSFKGGTSLSKGWNLISRFSEDIDVAISHKFYEIEPTSKSQREKLRKTSRQYIVANLSKQLEEKLTEYGVMGVKMVPITEQTMLNGETKPIDSDKDPTVLHMYYDSVLGSSVSYMLPFVKVEISCLSMDEPTEKRHLNSIVSNVFTKEDSDCVVDIRTVHPSRTFLEKIFLLAEEFQKQEPRTTRMSRHYYDLWQLLQSEYSNIALNDLDLYQRIIKHRETFYNVHYVDYSKHQPNKINFIPTDDLLGQYKDDYFQMQSGYIYGASPSFEELMLSMHTLQEKLHTIHTN